MPDVVTIFEARDYDDQVERGARMLNDGGIVVLPTETVYGAAGLLTHPSGLSRLKSLRDSSSEQPLTIHVPTASAAERFIGTPGELGKRMMRKLWPGPVALVFDVPEERRRQVVADTGLMEADIYDGQQITLRCPDHIVFSDIVGRVTGPVGLTRVDSTPWTGLDGKVDLIFDAGPGRFAKPSTIVQVRDDGYEIVRDGVYDRRIIERLMLTTVLFVCSGNTCRSPMAEVLARKAIAEKFGVPEADLESRGIVVTSAGSFGVPGARATPQAAEAVAQLGADLSRHRSRPLTVELIHQADHIFTMGRSHQAAVLTLVPSAADKTQLLSPDGDIDDPIGGDLQLYLSLAKHMEGLIQTRVVEKLNRP